MSTAEVTKRMEESSPFFKARITVLFYVVTILAGVVILFVHGRLSLVVDLVATGCYIAVTAVFYDLSR